MARNSGWKDWIPAGGKGHVLAEITGNVGNAKGGRNVFRSRGRFSRRRFRNDGRRVWVADPQAHMPANPVQLTNTGTTIVTGISPRLSQPTPTATTTPFDQKHRLVGMQGTIPVWKDPDDPGSVTLDKDTGAATGAPYLLFYVWKVIQLTVDALTPQATGSNSPDPTADLQVMLQADDVLNWGFRRILPNVMHPFGWKGVSTAGAVAATQTDENMFEPRMTFLPRPRIPRLGIVLGRDKALVLYVRPLQWSWTGQEWTNPTTNPLWAHPLLRGRYAL